KSSASGFSQAIFSDLVTYRSGKNYRAIYGSPYIHLYCLVKCQKKRFFPSLTAIVLACQPSPVFANDQKIDALLQSLTTPQKNYVPAAWDHKIDPKMLNKSYEVNWSISPKFNLTATELNAA